MEIRDDAYFSNGEKVTAEDVAFSANLMKEQVPNNARGMFTNFEVAEVVDDTHVSYTLSAPFAAFPNCWTSRCVPIICKSYYEGKSCWLRPLHFQEQGSRPVRYFGGQSRLLGRQACH